MAKKMTAAEIKAIDWAAILAKLPALAALVMQLIQLLSSASTRKAGKCPDGCPQEVCDACDAECAALAALIVAHCQLHDAIQGE